MKIEMTKTSEREFRCTTTTTSLLYYHFVFCPRHRRKIFLIPGLEKRFKELVCQACTKNGIVLMAMECRIDYVHIYAEAQPILSPADIMRLVKGSTTKVLLNEFADVLKGPTLWTRSYLASTEKLSKEEIAKYVESQRKR